MLSFKQKNRGLAGRTPHQLLSLTAFFSYPYD
jgi:hypothetical protein